MSTYKDKRLAKIAAAGGKFIKIDVGDTYKGKYITWKTDYDEKYKKTKCVFMFRAENGDEQQLSTSSKKVIAKMARVVPGSTITLTKLGEDRNLDYKVKVLDEGKAPSQDAPDEEEEVAEETPATEEETSEEEDDDEEDLSEDLF